MTQEIDLDEGIIIMEAVLLMEFAASQVARQQGSEQGGILKLGEGVRAGRISLDALGDDAKRELASLVEQMSLGAILRLPIRQIDPPRDNQRARNLPVDRLGVINEVEELEGMARWTLDSAPSAAWLHRIGSIGGRTFRVIALAESQIIVTPLVAPAVGSQPDAIADSVIRLQQRSGERIPLLRRAMSVEPGLPVTIDVVEVID